MTGRALLVVPLPGLAGSVPRLAESGYPSPFLALLDPFLPAPDAGTLAELTRLFGDVVPFATQVVGVSEFPGGTAYLAAHPLKPFRQLTHEVAHRFPEAGHHPASLADRPHVHLSRSPGESLEDLQREVEPWLPASALTAEAALWWQHEKSGAVTVVATFPFGTSAA